jgi:hypothetical protein
MFLLHPFVVLNRSTVNLNTLQSSSMPATGSDPAVKRESSGNPPAFEDRSGPLYNMLRALAAALLQQHSDDVETTSTAAETHVDQNAAVRQDINNGDNTNSNDVDNVAKRHDREFTQVHDIRRAARTVQDGGQLPSDGDNGAASSRAQHVADSTHDESGVSSSSEEWRTGPQEPSKAQAKANDLDDKDEHQSDNSMASSVEDWVASRVVAEMLIEKLSRERGQPTSAGGVSKNMDGARREGVNLDIAELAVYDVSLRIIMRPLPSQALSYAFLCPRPAPGGISALMFTGFSLCIFACSIMAAHRYQILRYC